MYECHSGHANNAFLKHTEEWLFQPWKGTRKTRGREMHLRQGGGRSVLVFIEEEKILSFFTNGYYSKKPSIWVQKT